MEYLWQDLNKSTNKECGLTKICYIELCFNVDCATNEELTAPIFLGPSETWRFFVCYPIPGKA